jgi:hypothetical protein
MKTFIEWLELREAGFFSNLFGKQPVQTTPAPAPPAAAPEKGNLEAIRRIFDAPKQDQDKQAQEAKPAPKAEAQPQLSSSPKNPEEYLEEVANKYWGAEKELPPFFSSFSAPGRLHEKWNKYKQKNDALELYDLYSDICFEEKSVGPIVEAVKNAMIEIIEKKLRWWSFPDNNPVELGPGRDQLDPDKAIFVDGKKVHSGMVKVHAKGMMDRKGKLIFEPRVERMGRNA